MRLQKIVVIFLLFIFSKSYAQDTLYFHVSNTWYAEDTNAKYLRKCVKENSYYHTWDYNSENRLVVEAFYSDTNFTTKLFCHKYYNELEGYLEQTKCYENGKLNGYSVGYNKNGDTLYYVIFKGNNVIKSWYKNAEDYMCILPVMHEAEYKGGATAWQAYLQKNIYRPDSLKNIKGRVVASFRVNPKGRIDEAEIIISLHPVLDKIVIEAIKRSPAWKPAKQEGKNVSYRMKQNVNFN